MKVRIHILFLLMIVLGGCAKSDSDPVTAERDVIFILKKINPAGVILDCPALTPDYARIIIDDIRYNIPVTSDQENFLTESFRLSAGNHKVSLVLLLDDNETPGHTADDKVVLAVPVKGSEFGTYVSRPTNFEFILDAGQTSSVEAEVICYQEPFKKKYGITFEITEIVIREQFFFGDICVTDMDAYAGSAYENQQNGIKVDMPAIFYISVSSNGQPVPGSPFSNQDWLGEGSPLCVQYPDNLNDNGEVFTFELFILVPDEEEGFQYRHYYTWTITDSEMIGSGTDAIVDFVLGNCVYSTSDLTISPQQYEWETAYAYSGNEEDCFLNYGFNRWGWVIGPFFPQDNLNASFDLYAAAGQCNLDAGINVGEVHVQYSQGFVIVTYTLDNPHIFSEINTYVGNSMFPTLPNGNPTVAPGYYGNNISFAPAAAISYYQETIQIPSPQLGFYIIAHAVVGIP